MSVSLCSSNSTEGPKPHCETREKVKTKTAPHALMELAIAALNARLLPRTDDIFLCARRPQAADCVRRARARVSELHIILTDVAQSPQVP